ncbi:NAD(P)/FAD-dependent oxidoreductase [Flavobacterium sp. NKUCC04_CG]|uniref:FAD-dependent oxidoreductase n=1 Tax=Flavobacterium sp. NKUCC04_CG TaxID=2842121 RepID=UPI001C5BA7A3|nr:NAD(P)/FAD-dependent oxidoreductase [Flavobacterium sp. NKUCC04_CG]MBW3518098.1 FAD-dependent monooxygenase [Flavobacterium sp. NKUCC04_CG]
MKKAEALKWRMCETCLGRGKKSRKLSTKARREYELLLDAFIKNPGEQTEPVRPKGHQYDCEQCGGSGLLSTAVFPLADIQNHPHIAIIGGGIGGVALAVACLHRGIPFTLFERDHDFSARSQGYGLTLQQASKAIEGLGLFSLKEGVVSTRHLVHTTSGKVIGEWGVRKWMNSALKSTSKRTNIHIARQALRLALLEQLGGQQFVNWGHQLIDLKQSDSGVGMTFRVDGEFKQFKADLVVGADGIRSSVRRLLMDENNDSLRYLGCIVILGICPLAALDGVESSLLDSATVFQTANGNERIYMMPYNADTIMWQLSFPMTEMEAKMLSAKGSQALKEEACRRTLWHAPIPQIMEATDAAQVSGYPVYDRELLQPQSLAHAGAVTLIGDAAHPMSPFKGQGANQALLDALMLARGISKGCGIFNPWRTQGIRNSVLTAFESAMLARSATKVKDSAEAAQFLHSEIVLYEGDEPRGRCLKTTYID